MIDRLAAFQHNSAESDLGREVGSRERLAGGDNKVEHIGSFGNQGDFIPVRAYHPISDLSVHLALVIEQQTDRPGRFEFLGKPVFHCQRNYGLLSRHFHWRNRDGQLRRGQQRAEQQSDYEEKAFHVL